jgi:hypothetical protein
MSHIFCHTNICHAFCVTVCHPRSSNPTPLQIINTQIVTTLSNLLLYIVMSHIILHIIFVTNFLSQLFITLYDANLCHTTCAACSMSQSLGDKESAHFMSQKACHTQYLAGSIPQTLFISLNHKSKKVSQSHSGAVFTTLYFLRNFFISISYDVFSPKNYKIFQSWLGSFMYKTICYFLQFINKTSQSLKTH